MKKLILFAFLAMTICAQAQFFGETNKSYLQVGPVFAKNNVGLSFSYEEQLGKYISLGISPILLLKKQKFTEDDGTEKDLKFGQKFDLKGKMSVHFSQVLKIEKFDIYPGLNLGIHNLGFHTGAQFYVAEGFAIYGEFNTPIAKYKEDSYSSFDKAYYLAGLSIDL